MKLHEFEANGLFKKYGLPVLDGYIITNPEEVRDFKGQVVLKAQVLVGGRGKAGGVKKAGSLGEARAKAKEILGMELKGIKVDKLFVVPAVEIRKEYYIGFTIDRGSRKVVFILTSEGGMGVEEVADKHPEKIVKYLVPDSGFEMYKVRELAKQIGLEGKEMLSISSIAYKLYKLFRDFDAELAEINPLALSGDGFLAVDSKLNVDDNALYRHKEIAELRKESEEYTVIEKKAMDADLSYVELDGDVAIIGCGAGLVMASLDAVNHFGGKPANFLDVGGGANAENMRKALELVLMKPGVKSIFINIFGGITKCDEIAKGILEFSPKAPVSIRMLGTHEEEGKRMLRDAGFKVYETMEEAAEEAVKLAGSGG